MNGTVKLVGLGLSARDHATVETLQALADAESVFAQGFSSADLAFLRSQCARGALKALEADADPAAVASAVCGAAKKGRRAAFATPIHPFYFGRAGAAVVAACDAAKVPWKSFGAISPMGVAIAEAGVTLGQNVFGLQSFEAEALAREAVSPNPVWPLILYFVRTPSASALAGLGKALAPLYAADRQALWCSGKLTGRTAVLSKALADAKKAAPGDTLYLPASRETSSTLGRTGSDSFGGKGASAPPRPEDPV